MQLSLHFVEQFFVRNVLCEKVGTGSRMTKLSCPECVMNTEPSLLVREQPKMPRLSDYKLIAFDMDSTLINIECVDEIAAAVGKKEEVAAITEAAMQGVISDFKESLRQRVALLKGVPESALQAIYDERLQLNPGAEELLAACKQAGLKTLLVSGGFTFFTERIRQRLGVDFTRANRLEIENGVLTGAILPQPWGDICDGAEKARTLLEVAALMGISTEQVIAVGDGANDLKMMQEASVSVAYKAKPTVRRQATIAINEGGLDRLLEVLPL